MKLHWCWFWRGPPRPSGSCWRPRQAFVTCRWDRDLVQSAQCDSMLTLGNCSPQLGKSVLYLTHQRVEMLGKWYQKIIGFARYTLNMFLCPEKGETFARSALHWLLLPLQSFLSYRRKLQRNVKVRTASNLQAQDNELQNANTFTLIKMSMSKFEITISPDHVFY